jgi:phospholipase/carboxylesterase
MSLISALSYPSKLGGIISMSGYIPFPSTFSSHIHPSNKTTPILMFHGKEDDVVKYKWGYDSYMKLKQEGLNVQFHAFDFMGHSACDEELAQMVKFVTDTLKQQPV